MKNHRIDNSDYNNSNDENKYSQNYSGDYNQNYDEDGYYDEYNQNNYPNNLYEDNYNEHYNGGYQEGSFEQNYYQQNNQNYNDRNYYQNNQNYNNQQFEQNYNNFEPRKGQCEEKIKKNGFVKIVLSLVAVLLLAGGGYFGYTKFIKEQNIVVDMTQYELEFIPNGTDGDGIAMASVKKIPDIKNASEDVKQFLQDPAITYNKNRNLSNGDKVEVVLSLSKSSAKAKKVELKGEFKRTFTVTGLKNKVNNNDNSNRTTTLTLRENPSKDTTKLEEYELSNWAKAIYIKETRGSTSSGLATDIWLGNDDLAYANVLRGSEVLARYRVNARGDLEKQSGSSWHRVSSIYTEL